MVLFPPVGGYGAVVALLLVLGGSRDLRTLPAPPKSAAPSGTSSARPLAASLPSDAILVVYRDFKAALESVPQAVLLRPEQYRALLERIEHLEQETARGATVPPGACRWTGRVEEDRVRLQGRLDFHTAKPRSRIALNARKAWLTGARLDGRPAVVVPAEEDGPVVEVDQSGDHRLVVEMEAALDAADARSGEVGFEVGLPRAAIQSLDGLALPAAVGEATVNGRRVPARPGAGGAGRNVALPLGAVDRLRVGWRPPAPPGPAGPALRAATAQIDAQLDHAGLTTTATLSLQVLRGEVRQWQIRVPANTVPEVPADRVDQVELPTPARPVLTLTLPAAEREALRVVLRTRQSQPAGRYAVGPYEVLGALRQEGTIVVTAPSDLRPHFRAGPDVVQREPPEDRGRDVSAFAYWRLASSGGPEPAGPAPLEFSVEKIHGSVEARVAHEATLEPGVGWRVRTRLDVVPVRTAVDRLELALPPAARFEPDQSAGVSPAELVENPPAVLDRPGGGRVLRITLAQKKRSPFSVTLGGRCLFAADASAGPVYFPRPTGTLDRGAQVRVVVPPGLELLPSASDPEAPPEGARRHTWSLEQAPDQWNPAWRVHPSNDRVISEVDVTLGARVSEVRQRLRFRFGEGLPPAVRLRLPDGLAGPVERTDGGRLDPDGRVPLSGLSGPEVEVALSYTFAAAPRTGPEDDAPRGREVTVPLVRPEGAGHVRTKVAAWTDAGFLLDAATSPGLWQEAPAEARPGPGSLPALVLQSDRVPAPAALAVKERPGLRLPSVVIGRGLVQAWVGGDGRASVRARFWAVRWNARFVDVELPAAATDLDPQVLIGGRPDPRLRVLDDGRTLRVEGGPELFDGPTVLEVRYRMPMPSGFVPLTRTWLAPPVPRGHALTGPVYWQVSLPPDVIGLAPWGCRTRGLTWRRQGVLLAPYPAESADDLERWLDPDGGSSAGGTPPGAAEPALALAGAGLRPLPLVLVPQAAWLLGCSLLVFGLGALWIYGPLPRPVFWGGLAAAGAALTAALGWWPGGLPAVAYGAQPGAAALLVVVLLQWGMGRRRRPRSAATFRRGPQVQVAGRLGSSVRPARGEPATVELPTGSGVRGG